MTGRILDSLRGVQARQTAISATKGAAAGLFGGAVAALLLGIARFTGGTTLSPSWGFGMMLAGPIAGAALAALRPRNWKTAAAAVDASYGLKDRVVTSVEFVNLPHGTSLHELQIRDAEQHLANVDARRVAPVRMPRSLPVAAGLSALAITLLLWPRGNTQAGPAAPLAEVVAAADQAKESLDELEEVAKKEKDADLEKLVKQLKQKADEMKEPGVDVKEALAKLSEMQATIQAQQAQYNVGLVDAQMSALGEALASASAFEAAGNALEQQNYDKAAAELEKADPKVDRKTAKSLKEKLKKAAKAMQDAQLGELSEATEQLADALDEERDCQGECKKLGKLARAQGKRKRINDLLNSQCRNLGECKGECKNPKNSTAKFKLKKKSDKPSSNWGMATSGNTEGEATKLDSERNRQDIKGQMGEGPSETETAHLPEGRQTATREYKDMYKKYKQMTEAALDSEPIPLGHRQTIRKYFELIRPDNDEAEKSDAPAKSTPNP